MTLDERIAPLAQVREALRRPDHLDVARRAVADSLTLVKDRDTLLPISPVHHQRVVVISDEGTSFFAGAPDRDFTPLVQGLEERGFNVRNFDPDAMPTPEDTDLVLYLIGQEATPGLSHIFLDFAKLHAGPRNAMIQYNQEIPTLLVSFGQPYYLYDAPNFSTYINAYASLSDVQTALVERLVGKAPFTGVSPVDAFCGKAQLRW